jgi:restriction endonuclease S subunit
LPIKKIKDGFTYFRKGDVVIAKITPCFENGKGASLSNLASEFGFGTTELIVLRPIDQVLGSYLRLIFSSKSFLGLGAQFMIGAAGQKRIPVNFVRNFELGIPSLTEQNEIINKLKIELEKLNKVLQATKIEISLMQEYKNRLVSDIVTGKVDVRNIEIPEFEKVDEQTLPNEEEEENLEEMEA